MISQYFIFPFHEKSEKHKIDLKYCFVVYTHSVSRVTGQSSKHSVVEE